MTTLVDEVRASEDYRTLVQAQDEATPMYVGVMENGDMAVQVAKCCF